MGMLVSTRARAHGCAESVLHRHIHAIDAGSELRVRLLSARTHAHGYSPDERHAGLRRWHAYASGRDVAHRSVGAGIARSRSLHAKYLAFRPRSGVASARSTRAANAALYRPVWGRSDVRLLPQESVMFSDQRPLSIVPRAVWLALLAALAMQVAWQSTQPKPVASAAALTPPPPFAALRVVAAGEPNVLAQLLT